MMDVSGVTVIGSNRVDSVDIDDENEPILVKDEDENEPQKKKPKNKNASLVWDHFSKGEKVANLGATVGWDLKKGMDVAGKWELNN